MAMVFGSWGRSRKGVGFPSSEAIVGASRSVLWAGGAGGRTAQGGAAFAGSAITWRSRSTGAASAKREVPPAVALTTIKPGLLARYCTVPVPPTGVALPERTVWRTASPESAVADTKKSVTTTRGYGGEDAPFTAGSQASFSVMV